MTPAGASPPVAPRDAASVILIRGREGCREAEVLMVRRHPRAGFMASSFVFPGGALQPDDRDLRETAARELFEEAGVLLAGDPGLTADLVEWRQALRRGRSFRDLLETTGVELALDDMIWFAHWITPSIEQRRYSNRFFVADLPPGQTPQFDDVETVDQVWVTPAEALARSAELRLPPPQVRIMHDLSESAPDGPPAVRELARRRARHPIPIMPRAASLESAPGGFAILLPWDPDYATTPGDGISMPPDHPLACGPSRFVLGNQGWQLVSA